ncbi:MAG: hypothetical protein K940chlam9_00231 [Chlamydiae bacterium]|nr:hypothetical protein [Chlamydiota bacterium]
MPQTTHVNGIDCQKLETSIGQIRENKELGKFKLRAHNSWHEGGHCETKISDFYGLCKEQNVRKETFSLHADEPAMLCGTDKGPNATEALLHALASCLNTTFVYMAARKGIAIESLKFELEGDLDLRGFLGIDEEIPKGFQKIRITCHAKGDAPKDQLAQLCQLAQKYSPVFNTLTRSVPVEVHFNG